MREHIESITSTRFETVSSCWTGWTTSASTGPSVAADGTTLRSHLVQRDQSRSSFHRWNVCPTVERSATSRQPCARQRIQEDLGAFEDVKATLGAIVGEEKVFDTWMDSSNSNLFVSGFLNHPEVFEKAFPTALRPQARKSSYVVVLHPLKSTLVLDQPGFQHVWIDGLGMDPWGRKMSKSLGNGIDADSVLECGAGGRTGSWQVKGPDGSVKLRANKIGSECFRLWKACDAQVGDDFHIIPEEIEKKYFGVLTKLFNVARFASQFDVPEDLDAAPEHLAPEDRWVLAEFQQTMSRWRQHG